MRDIGIAAFSWTAICRRTVIGFACAPVCLIALTAHAAAPRGAGEAELRRVYEQADQAWDRKDYNALAAAIAPNFRYGGQGGKAHNRDTFLRQVRKAWGNSTSTSRQSTIAQIVVDPASTRAIVTSRREVSYDMQGQHVVSRSLDVAHWVKINGRWIVDEDRERDAAWSGANTRGPHGMDFATASQWGQVMSRNMLYHDRQLACAVGLGADCHHVGPVAWP